MNNVPATTHNQGLLAIIDRAAADPNFDVDKLQRLLEMHEASEQRAEQHAFTAALSAAEAEMDTIRTDMSNPQTRSRYASFAQLDGAVRPIYTKHGFALSFTTEPMGTPDNLLVVCTLSHRQGHAKRLQLPVPITTTGFKGQQMMTPVHATMAAVSYGKRNLECMAFNLQVGDVDDDGNRAGGGTGTRRPPPPAGERAQRQQQPPFELVHPITGEIITTPTPIPVTRDDYRGWGEKFVGVLNNLAQSIEEQDRWIELNADTIQKLQEQKFPWFNAFNHAIGNAKARHLDPQ